MQHLLQFFSCMNVQLVLYANNISDNSTRFYIFLPDSLNDYNDSFYSEVMIFEIDSIGNVGEPGYAIWAGSLYVENDLENIMAHMPQWMPAYDSNFRSHKKRYLNFPAGLDIKYYYYSKRPSQKNQVEH